MSDPKLHHYVPQFYLRRFANATGQIFVWDKKLDRSFATSPRNLAAEHDFYWHDELAVHGHDPLTLEKQLSTIREGGVAHTSAAHGNGGVDCPTHRSTS